MSMLVPRYPHNATMDPPAVSVAGLRSWEDLEYEINLEINCEEEVVCPMDETPS